MDQLAPFLSARCMLEQEAWVPSGELYGVYRSWCEENGERDVFSHQEFINALKERGFIAVRKYAGRGWRGLRLRTMYDVDQGPVYQSTDIHELGTIDN